MDKKFTVSVSVGTILTTLVILASAYALWILRDLFLLVLTAIVIASAIEPGVAFFARRKFPRLLSVLLMYALVFGAVFSFVYFFLPPILDDAQEFLASVPRYLDTIQLPEPLSPVTHATSLLSNSATSEGASILRSLLFVRQSFTDTSAGAIRLFATFFGGIFSFMLVVVLSFYFAVQNTGVEDFLRLITPAKQEEYVVGLWKRAQKKIGLWMQGQILLSVIVGVLVYLGMLIMGIPYALLLAIFTALAELIPIFGSLIAGGLATAVAFSTGGLALAFIVAGLFIIVNQFETNLIYPLVVRKIIGIPPLLVIIALIAGGELAGFLGVLLSVPLAAAAQEFFADLDKGKRGLA